MTAVRRLTTLLCLSLFATSVLAQTPETTVRRTTDAVTAETDRDVNDPRALKLSLEDALRTAMQRNLGVELQSYDYRMSGHSLRSQYTLYDWFGQATIEHGEAEGATISQTEPTSSGVTRANFGVAQNLPAGGNYFLGLNSNRQTTVGGFTDVSPAYRPSLVFAATQPLARNFGIDVTRRGILIARNTLGINREQFRTALMDTAVSVEQAYLDLVYARRAVEVVKESLFLARDQARITQIRIDVGASAPLDILQPRVTIATTEEQLITSVALVRDAEDRLRALLNLDPAEWDRPIVPTDPVEYTALPVNPETAVARALELRPELRQAELTTDTRRVQYVYARNQVLPQLDFNIDYSASGVAGRTPIVDPVTGQPTGRFNSTGYGDALTQVFGNDFPSWTFGLQVGVPITNIGARAEARRAELDLRSSRVSQQQTRQSVTIAVRAAARDVETTSRTIVASRTAREAAERNLEAERRRYENGMTTNFQVLQIQQQLSDSRVRELQALVGYNQAVANYHRQVGDILEARNITIDEPEIPQEPRVFSFLDRYNWLNYGSRVRTEETMNDR
jgi:outer membrane protein